MIALRVDEPGWYDPVGAGWPPPGAGGAAGRLDGAGPRRFRHVTLHLTEPVPPAPTGRGDNRIGGPHRMAWSRAAATLESWRRMGGTDLCVLDDGPLPHPDFVSTLRLARTLGYERVSTTTGGLAPVARELAQLAPSELSYVEVSLYGGSHLTHDQARRPGAFAQAVATASDLAERGFEVRFGCTVTRTNREDCLRLLDVADDLGVAQVTFRPASATGQGTDRAEQTTSPREWVAFYEALPSAVAGRTTQVRIQPTWASAEGAVRFTEAGFAGCRGRALDRISVFPDGRSYVCSYLAGTPLHFATTGRDGTITLNRERNEFDLFTAGLTQPACGDCRGMSACGGGCPAEQVVDGAASCETDPTLVPVCRLWTTPVARPTRTALGLADLPNPLAEAASAERDRAEGAG